MKIEILAEKEDVTPERSEELHGFAEGFAECVRNNQKISREWGWCTVVVRITTPNGVGEASLGGCSYHSAEDFIKNSGYFSDLVKEAMEVIDTQ